MMHDCMRLDTTARARPQAIIKAVLIAHVLFATYLRGADVASRFVAPDVLLTCLHRHAQRRLARRVAAHACRQCPTL